MQSLITIVRLPHGEGVELPSYAHAGDAGADIRAAVSEPVTIGPGERKLIPSGLTFEIPLELEVQVRSRSGLSLKHGVIVLNSPGTIDAGYRGEVGVILANFGTVPFVVNRGDRVAQLVVAKVEHASFSEGTLLAESARGAGGFGSTGT